MTTSPTAIMRFRLLLIASVLTIALSACGGDSSSKVINEADDSAPISAILFKGPVDGATCRIYQIDSNGKRLTTQLGNAKTSGGEANFDRITYIGPAIIECKGGTYTDEATGTRDVPAPNLRAVVTVTRAGSYVITPLTEIAVKLGEKEGDLTSVVDKYNPLVADALGLDELDITTVKPTDIMKEKAADTPEGQYGVLLGLVSKMSLDSGSADSDMKERVETLMVELEAELSDGDLNDEMGKRVGDAIDSFKLPDDVSDNLPSREKMDEIKARVGIVVSANAGDDTIVSEQSELSLVGKAKIAHTGDFNGLEPGISYHWEQLNGIAVVLSGSKSDSVTFTSPEVLEHEGPQILTFRFTATFAGYSASDLVRVTIRAVNSAPEAFAGKDKRVAERQWFTINGDGIDSDGDVTGYSWSQLNGYMIALFNETTKDLSFRAPLVSENDTEALTFQLTVTDNEGKSSSDEVTVVVLDTDELTPSLHSDYNFTILESINKNSTIGQIDHKGAGDSLIVEYRMWKEQAVSSDTESDLFAIDSQGNIKLKPNAKLDYEKEREHTVYVAARNGAGWSSRSRVVISVTDVADVKPVLSTSNTHFVVKEDTAPGVTFGTIKVLSTDSQISHYQIQYSKNFSASEQSGLFEVDSEGNIKIKNNAHLDYEKEDLYILYAWALNSAGWSENPLEIRVDIVNTDEPFRIFHDNDMNVYENSAPGTYVGKVLVTNDNGDLSSLVLMYKDNAGEFTTTDSPFTVDLDGNIVVSSSGKLDYEETSRHTIRVLGENTANQQASETFDILVLNRIDQRPKIKIPDSLKVVENSIGGYIGRVSVTGEGDAAEVTDFQLTRGVKYFEVDRKSGEIFIKRDDGGSVIDFETAIKSNNDNKRFHHITIEAVNAAGRTIETNFVEVVDLPNISISNTMVEENDAGISPLNFTISKQFKYDGNGLPGADNVQVGYTITGLTATQGVDYEIPQRLYIEIPEDEMDAVITVNVIGDRDKEYTESVEVTITSVTGSADLFERHVATGYIVNDDLTVVNDTGVDWQAGYQSGNNYYDCSDIEGNSEFNLSQDCHHGRDALARKGQIVKFGGGSAGFDFSKLRSDGVPLKEQDVSWSSSGSEELYSKWSCVRDNFTGLVWEVKSDDTNSIHHMSTTYRWGGQSAQGDSDEIPLGNYYSDWSALVDNSAKEQLCGYDTWRVPTYAELRSIVDYGEHGSNSLPFDSDFFPHALFNYTWTSLGYSHDSSKAWAINFTGHNDNILRSQYNSVRLVAD